MYIIDRSIDRYIHTYVSSYLYIYVQKEERSEREKDNNKIEMVTMLMLLRTLVLSNISLFCKIYTFAIRL